MSVYVGTGQIADMPEGERQSYGFALEQARERGGHGDDCGTEEELVGIGPPPHGVDGMLVSRRWVEWFGGSFAGDLSTGGLIWNALKADEVNLVDIVKFGQGNRFSLDHLWPELRELSLIGITEFRVPVVFLLGRYDRQIPSDLAAGWFERIRAPVKRLLWFEQSAHNPPFEEPERFVRAMVGEVLPLAGSEPSILQPIRQRQATRGRGRLSGRLRRRMRCAGRSPLRPAVCATGRGRGPGA